MISPHYETSRSIVDVDMDKPFIITASEHQIVFQDYKDLSKEFQCLNIYNDDGIWRTEAFGPIREIDVNRITKYWEKYIPVKAFINDHLFAVSYECKWMIGYTNLKIWSSVTRELIWDDYIFGLSDILLDKKMSRLILIQERIIELLKFEGNKLISRKRNYNDSPICKSYPHNGVIAKMCSPFVVLWEPFCSTNKLHHWKIDLEEENISKYKVIVDFNYFSNASHPSLINEIKIRDGTFVNGLYIIVYERFTAGRNTHLLVTNEEGNLCNKMLLFQGSYLTNCRIFVNDYRLILKVWRYIYDEIVMFDLSDLNQFHEENNLAHSKFENFKTKNLSYRIYDHYYSEGGKDYGYIVTNSSIIRIAVIGHDYQVEKFQLNFLPED